MSSNVHVTTIIRVLEHVEPLSQNRRTCPICLLTAKADGYVVPHLRGGWALSGNNGAFIDRGSAL